MISMAERQALDFSNTEIAYKYKSLADLKQAEWMFKMLNAPVIGTLGKSFLKFAVNVGLPVKGAIKATLYKHFVGGETLEDCLPQVEKLARFNVKSILDYSVEGTESEADHKKAVDELVRNIKFASQHKEIPFAVFKPTGFASTPILEKVSNNIPLNAEEEKEFARIKERFELLAKTAYDQNVQLMIDAEETWIQKAIDDIAEELMAKYNREQVIIINTLQMYRKDRLAFLKNSYAIAQQKGYKLGIKFVRGAYMEKERKRAAEKGYPSPIQDTKEDSDRDFDAAVTFCLERINDIFTFIGTHNEKSSMLGANWLAEKGLPLNHPHVWFSQLYGMSDHISFNLGAQGYNVVKYIPYGPVASVTPYLIRRADENSSMAGQAGREMSLIRQEIERRQGK